MLATSPLYSVVVQSGWALVAVLFLLDGYRRPSRVRARMGLGLLIIAVSQLYRAIVPGQEPVAGLVYPSLRVLGMGVVLAALLTMALRTVTRMQDDYDQLQDTLGEASALLERATGQTAERDHELRNGLAGLAGAAQLLTTRPGGDDPQLARMREAVLAELNRLRQMLQTPVAVDDAAADPTTGRSDAALLDFGPEYAPVASSPGGRHRRRARRRGGPAHPGGPARRPLHHPRHPGRPAPGRGARVADPPGRDEPAGQLRPARAPDPGGGAGPARR